MEPLQYEERGYLHEDFRLFHLADDNHGEFPYHYHAFHKVIAVLAGRTEYAVEGERYTLQPGDFVLVGRGCIHRPIMTEGTFYERVVFYISPEYLQSISREGEDLETCFRLAQERFCYVYRAEEEDGLQSLFTALEAAREDRAFGSALRSRALFTELMVAINRAVIRGERGGEGRGDNKIVAILQYLNAHLTETLTIDELAARFYISKYHMMRRFREETGYTIHNYIAEKRLMLAQQLLQRGFSLTAAAEQSGYQDYSTFSRAYKKQFGHAPSAK
ncbi:MAG: helix-turn-helix domain-containing protein [Oscillospiraceae bacterium]|nr:helix-turn-helix domain-containing protein [Oscillospiraceae bacterium]